MRAAWTTFAVAIMAIVLVIGCSGDDNGIGAGGNANTGGNNTGGGITDTLVIEPPTATIVVDNGSSSPLQLVAKYKGEQVYPSSWQTDHNGIADVTAQGLVTAVGTKGGQVTVTAEYEGMTGTAVITVMIKKTSNPAGATQEDQNKLKAASAWDQGIVWTYPYDRTVWPTGLLPPEMMWNNGGDGDIYYLHFTGNYVDVEVFLNAAPPSRYPIDQADWTIVNESGAGEDVKVELARLQPAAPEATRVVEHTWKMAPGSLRGTVYYWANNLGRIVRIKPGATAPEDFLASAGVNGCTACHAVSANGHTLLIGGDVDTSNYDLVNDTTMMSLPSVGKAVRNWAMPAISPDGKYVVENNAPLPGPPGGSDGLYDAVTGQRVPNSGLDGAWLDMPAFGPAGTKLAFVDHGGSHDLYAYNFDLANGQAVGNPLLLVGAGSDPNLNAIAFPSVSPSVKKTQSDVHTWIVYHRGSYPGSLDTRMGNGYLYLASADQPGVEMRLAEATGDNYPFAAGDRDRHYNYEPTFAPATAGGYMWVVFTSRRTYGNRLTGASDQVKQLWVAAIDQFAEPGTDPSHPAFWVPGQDMSSLNMRGYWALDPCIQQGNMCTTDAECCDGKKCENGLCGGPDTCAQNGELCDGDADCCDPSQLCIGGSCQLPPPE